MVYPTDFNVLEKFTVLLYDRSSSESSVVAARRTLFTQENRLYDAIPPTRAALFQHVLHAAKPGRIHLGTILIAHTALPHQNKWG